MTNLMAQLKPTATCVLKTSLSYDAANQSLTVTSDAEQVCVHCGLEVSLASRQTQAGLG